MILCPDHLIGKWVRELEETIPGAIVTRFGPQGGDDEPKPAKGAKRKKGEPKKEPNTKATLGDVLKLLDKSQNHRWKKPEGPEWFVLGRNQAKWLSDWAGIANEYPGYDDPVARRSGIARIATIREHALSSKNAVIDTEYVVDDRGNVLYNGMGRAVKKNITARVHTCPNCGQIIRNKKGTPLGPNHLKKINAQSSAQTCQGTYLQMLPSGPEAPPHGLQRITFDEIRSPHAGRELGSLDGYVDKIGTEVNHGGFKWVVKKCGEPLYNYTSRPYRWAPALVIQRKCRRLFDYLIIDEVHEQKSDESAQSMACGKLIGSARHVIALTGTLIGGYANHIFPLLMRIAPKTLRELGFEWGKDMAFSEAYGRIDRIVTIKESDEGSTGARGNQKSMRRARGGTKTETKAVRPGVMPTLFGHHMIGHCLFITLDEMSSELPDLYEYVGGPCPAPTAGMTEEEKDSWCAMENGHFDVACDMEPEQRDEYRRVVSYLEYANKELLQRGSMKLLGTYLWTGLDYPDKPFGWGHDPDYVKAFKQAQAEGRIGKDVQMTHTLGYWDKPRDRTAENFIGVVTPKDCPEDRVYPKEQKLIDICLKQKKEGRQTWVYVQMTGKRNVQPRLKKLLEARGLKVGVLRADDVEPIEREEWIAKHGREFDVMISHPQLVSTGLDLFSKRQGGHNYSTLVFYETGYNLFTMRQAARRAWRIGQPLDCRVYYLYYKETMQHNAMKLMSKKMSAAQALEGEFSEEGLAAMAGDDNLQMAMAKNLSEGIDDADMQRNWTKVKSGPKKARPVGQSVADLSQGSKPSPLDNLPIELQLVADSMIENQARPIPADTLAELGALGKKLADLDAGFDALAVEEVNEEFAHHNEEESGFKAADEEVEDFLEMLGDYELDHPKGSSRRDSR